MIRLWMWGCLGEASFYLVGQQDLREGVGRGAVAITVK